MTARGWRQPKAGETVQTVEQRRGRHGRAIDLVVTKPAWPVVDLYAFRCPECHEDQVWDMRTDEWWTLDDSDYGPTGSVRPAPREWSGGLFDLLPADETPTETSRSKP